MWKFSSKSVFKDGKWSGFITPFGDRRTFKSTFNLGDRNHQDLFIHNIRVNVECDLYNYKGKIKSIKPNSPFTIPPRKFTIFSYFRLEFPVVERECKTQYETEYQSSYSKNEIEITYDVIVITRYTDDEEYVYLASNNVLTDDDLGVKYCQGMAMKL